MIRHGRGFSLPKKICKAQVNYTCDGKKFFFRVMLSSAKKFA